LRKGVWKQESGVGIAGIGVLFAGAIFGQAPTALMSTRDVNQVCTRSTQLMEAGGVSVPELQRAAAPMIENARQACVQLAARPGYGQSTYVLMMNLRAYLTLADAVPKPFPFPDAARQQFSELRDNSTRLDSHFQALLDSKDTQIRSSDRDNLQRYGEANRKLAQPDPKNPRVVFLGDSITDAWRLNEYFPDKDFVNRGISGQITSQMLDRMKADVIDLHPDAVLILGGTNDLARQIPLTAIENNYMMIVDLASAAKIKVIFASVMPVSDYHKDDNPAYEMTKDRPPLFIKALNEWIERLCTQRGFTFLNYHSALVDSAGQMQGDLSDDGLHPNSKGYRIMAPLALQAIQKTAAPPKPAAVPAKPGKRGTTSN
jgi:lysophospholipase L1-like esterase